MAKKITELPVAQTGSESDLYPVVQSANTRKQTRSQLRTAIVSGFSAFVQSFLGAADAAAGRLALALGTVATRAAQATTTDTTGVGTGTARIMAVGAFGWNGGTATSQAAGVDANTLTTSGVHAFGGGGVNLPTNSTAYYLRVSNHGALILQEAFGMTNVASKLVAWRNFDGTQWNAWNFQGVIGSASNSIDGAFANLTLQNSWTVTASRRAVFRKFLDEVELQFSIGGGTAADGTAIFTLPIGFRPPSQIVQPVTANPTATPSTTVPVPSVAISTAGVVSILNCSNVVVSATFKFPIV